MVGGWWRGRDVPLEQVITLCAQSLYAGGCSSCADLRVQRVAEVREFPLDELVDELGVKTLAHLLGDLLDDGLGEKVGVGRIEFCTVVVGDATDSFNGHTVIDEVQEEFQEELLVGVFQVDILAGLCDLVSLRDLVTRLALVSHLEGWCEVVRWLVIGGCVVAWC